ncbi:MAG TPA: DASS family sodium-coupled anion symporter [Nocardiopsis listeri]|uniref:SLC13 family permease n=1 Tax=Nocardiopsis listeri TaxID=53440 RepID=UPI001DFCB2A9|nr:DASS family sodium-coupled anion symporter [Nocardiopsis listeri]HJE61667.1 DASS family sodium-coupled anion symporter [Nocardiopsis listeri]
MQETTDQAKPVQDSESPEAPVEKRSTVRRKFLGLVLGVVAAIATFYALPADMPEAARATTTVAVVMAVWWMTEAIPIAATSLLPIVLFPVLGVTDTSSAASPYAAEVVFLLLGGYMLGQAMQRWTLHRRLALLVILGVGTNPVKLVAGFMLVTAFISLWVSNAASTVMMLPIGLSVLMMVRQMSGGKIESNFGCALMLGIAYAATIGGMASIVSTPPNALLIGYLADSHDIHITFLDWFTFGFPIAAVFLFLAWIILTRVVFPIRVRKVEGSKEAIREDLRSMGPLAAGEWAVIAIFVFAAFSWVAVPLLADSALIGNALPWLAHVTDAGIAMTVALLLFLVPVKPGKGVKVLDWGSTKEIPWGMLLLVGGGLSLSAQITESGLADWIGDQATVLSMLPALAVILAIGVTISLLTELTSNTAAAATFIPLFGGIAIGLDLPVLLLVLPAVLTTQMAFMLPVATPPNAMAFGTGYVTMGQLIRGGALLNLLGLVLMTVAMYTLAGWVFGFTF